MDLNGSDLSELKNAEILNLNLPVSKLRFSGVSTDSRTCGKNELFFAIKGEKYDGHNFVLKVLSSGVKCAVVNKRWFNGLNSRVKSSFKNKCIIKVSNTVETLGELANIYRKKYIIPVIGIAGSNGKTSTKDFIAHVLSKRYNVLKTQGNLNNAIGVPLTLFRLNSSHEIAVLELGTNHFGEIEYLCRISEPQFGLVTNIGKEHLEFLKNIAGVAKAEGELAEWLKKVFGTFFVNTDDEYVRKMMDKNKLNIFTYGTGKDADVRGKIKKFSLFYPEIEIKYKGNIINTRLNNIGYQSFSSALSAAAVGAYFGISSGKIKAALKEYRIESGKRNQLKNINGIWVIDDTYNSNPDSVKAALENLKAYKVKGSKYIVLGDMLELGKTSKKEHRQAGLLVRKMGFENLLTYGRDSYHTFLGAKGLKNNYHFPDKETLAEFLKLIIVKGDVVLVKGSRSVKMEEIIEKLSRK